MEKIDIIVSGNGNKIYKLKENIHRENDRAVIRADGSQEWWLHGKLHRVDGPAVTHSDGTTTYFLFGNRMTRIPSFIKQHRFLPYRMLKEVYSVYLQKTSPTN